MNADAPSDRIYSDWILTLLRDLGQQSNWGRSFTTWESLEILLDLSEDARKRALKQKGGKGFPRNYNVFSFVQSALVQMGDEYCGPAPMLRICAQHLAAHGVDIPEVSEPDSHLGDFWMRGSQVGCRRALTKALDMQASNLAELKPDESAFIAACTAIALRCGIEASPAATRSDAAEADSTPGGRLTEGADVGTNAAGCEQPLDSPGADDAAPAGRQSAAAPSPLALMLPLLLGTAVPVDLLAPATEAAERRDAPALFDDGLGPVDYGLPVTEAELMGRLLPPDLAEQLARAGIQPESPCRAEPLAQAAPLIAQWIAVDSGHRFAMLAGRARLVFSPLCDRALMLSRIKTLRDTLADSPENSTLDAGMLFLLIRSAQGDEARLLAGLFIMLALGNTCAGLIGSTLRP